MRTLLGRPVSATVFAYRGRWWIPPRQTPGRPLAPEPRHSSRYADRARASSVPRPNTQQLAGLPMGEILVLSLLASLNPVLVTATTLMLLLDRPARLMFGWWLGAMLTSVTLGNVIVFALRGSGFEKTSKNTAHPALVLALAGLLLVVVLVLATGRDKSYRERRAARRNEKHSRDKDEPPKWQRTLSKGSPRATFVLGVCLTLPGGSYLAALDKLGKLHYSTVATVLVVIVMCLLQQILLEVPMVAYRIAPEQTPAAVDRAKAWAGAHWRNVAIYGLSVIVVGLVAIGVNELVR